MPNSIPQFGMNEFVPGVDGPLFLTHKCKAKKVVLNYL